MQILTTELRNAVLASMEKELHQKRAEIVAANQKDLDHFAGNDQALYDRLIINEAKIDGMIASVRKVREEEDPIGKVKYQWTHPNGMDIYNRTAPFGTIMIIYESRPDVTIEAACVAFKSNNKILLKGGKEAHHSNEVLVDCWHAALAAHDLSEQWISYLKLPREKTQEYLRNPPQAIDLIVPRGGDGLINFVKTHATCPVLVSGRGNNFVYVHDDADWDMAKKIILHSKTDKISACNALDKVLINSNIKDVKNKLAELAQHLRNAQVQVLLDESCTSYAAATEDTFNTDPQAWAEEYLAMRLMIGIVDNASSAIKLINRYSGGHSCAIITENKDIADQFMSQVDAAAVYHNAATRFTDGGQMGMGAELAISTDKLHHRGPLGLQQLVTNKWFIYGKGQIRE